MSDTYKQFIAGKSRVVRPMGFEPIVTNPNPFPFQKSIIEWSVRRGRAALFAGTGLGKTLMQLEWASQVATHTGKPVMVHCPLGVRTQTLHEAERFGISTRTLIVDDGCEVPNGPCICIANYDKLHKFDLNLFCGVVLDESSILKSFTGATKRALIAGYRNTPYKLACTATPAPNDHMELGNHAEFLGVMPSNEMLSRWFINDTMNAGGYRLIRHGQKDFWHWVSSWAVCVTTPSDIGNYDDSAYELPPLRRHVLDVEFEEEPANGELFPSIVVNATTVHKVKRKSAARRADVVSQIIAERGGRWVVWCDTDYEADELLTCIEAVSDSVCEVRGSQSNAIKEKTLTEFSEGKWDVIISKPGLAGFGLNWQHVHQVAFVGLSYSFEQYYQAVRRCWRFGQTQPVDVFIVNTEAENAMMETVQRKEKQHASMADHMSEAMSQFQSSGLSRELLRDKYVATRKMEIPKWIMK